MTTKLFPVSLSQEKCDGIKGVSGYKKLKNVKERVQLVHLLDSINIASHHFGRKITGMDKLLWKIGATMKLGRYQEPDYKYVFPPKVALRPLANEILFGLWSQRLVLFVNTFYTHEFHKLVFAAFDGKRT